MGISSFLYRRLCRFVTCELRLPSGGRLALRTKYDVASCSDVFCHPFYWTALSFLTAPPGHIVDCGACCGHFSILADTFLKSRFGHAESRFTLIEANPLAIPVLKRNLADAGLLERAAVVHSLLGNDSPPFASLWVDHRNWLTASTRPRPRTRQFRVATSRLASHAGKGSPELLKIDIEGAEHQRLESEPEAFRGATMVLAELHGSPQQQEGFIARSAMLGLHLIGVPFHHAGHLLVALARNESLPHSIVFMD
jgi:FkbM family methyltransferase